MTNAELLAKIKAEIERRLANYHPEFVNHGLASGFREDGKAIAYEELLSFLSTLESEKPMNLKDEINRYLREECSNDDEPSISETARHFAQWQKEQMMNEAVEVQVVGEQRDLRLIDSTQRCLFNANRGDWLKIIIVKEDEK